jgi:hypothetical protein
MRVFVAGANGAVGGRLVPMLVARGHQVTGTTTSESRRTPSARGPVVVDGLDAVGISEAVAKAEPDAIIHEMTVLSGTPDFRHFDRRSSRRTRSGRCSRSSCLRGATSTYRRVDRPFGGCRRSHMAIAPGSDRRCGATRNAGRLIRTIDAIAATQMTNIRISGTRA